MGLGEKKQALLDIVEDADEKLTGLLIALANEYNTSGEKYSQEELEGVYQERDIFLSNTGKGYTPKDAHMLIRNKRRDAI